MSLKKYSQNIMTLLFACALPGSFLIYWLSLNSQLPVSDSANYLQTALDIRDQFKLGFYQGFTACYWLRGWRPILYPVFIVPFLLIKNDLFFSYYSLVLIFFLFSMVYIYLIFRLYLEKYPAILCTNLIGSLPFFLLPLIDFYAESALFPFLLASIYHLIKSNYLKDKKHLLASIFFLSIALLIRPIEVLIHCILPFGFYTYLLLKHNKINVRHIILLSNVIIACLVFLFLQAWLNIDDKKNLIVGNMELLIQYSLITTIVLLLIDFILVILLRKKDPLNKDNQASSFLLYNIIPIIVIIVWFLPFTLETFHWIYRASIGDVAVGSLRIGGAYSFWNEMIGQILAGGAFVLISCFLLGLYSFCRYSYSGEKRNNLILLFLIAVLPILEVFFTVQDSSRKLSLAIPVLVMLSLIFFLNIPSVNKKLNFKTLLISIVLLIHFSLLTIIVFGKNEINAFYNFTIGYYIHRPVTSNPNPHQVLLDFFAQQNKEYGYKSIGLEVNTNLNEPIDPFLLGTMVRAKTANFYANYLYFSTYDENYLKEIIAKYDVIFLADKASQMEQTKKAADLYLNLYNSEKSASLKVYYKLLLLYSRKELQNLNLKLLACINIKAACIEEQTGVRTVNCQACLLTKINN